MFGAKKTTQTLLVVDLNVFVCVLEGRGGVANVAQKPPQDEFISVSR